MTSQSKNRSFLGQRTRNRHRHIFMSDQDLSDPAPIRALRASGQLHERDGYATLSDEALSMQDYSAINPAELTENRRRGQTLAALSPPKKQAT